MIDWHGSSRQPCPACDRGPKDRALGVTLNPDGSGVARCFRCEYIETMQGTKRPGAPLAPRVSPSKHEVLSDYGRELWRTAEPVTGMALAYLQARCCVIPPADGHLRYQPSLKHPPSGASGPALVALLTDALTREPLSIHRTWSKPDGTKADLDPPRMLLGGHRKAGGVIRLWPDEAVTTGLAIAEGIETALSLAHAYTPAWATVDAGNMAAFPVLPGVESMLIAADHDPAGIEAAEACAERWARAGREVRVVMPEAYKTDINDLARAEA